MNIIQIPILIFTLFALSRVFINIRNKTFKELEGFFWVTFWFLASIAAIFPQVVSYIGDRVGIKTGSDIAVYISLIFLTYLIFRLYAKLDKQNKAITKIVRKIAIENERKPSKNNR